MPKSASGPSAIVDPFQRDADLVARQIRERFIPVIEARCGGSPRAHEVADAFKVHRKLGWQLWNVAYGEEPLLSLQYMPSAHGIRVWHQAAANCGVADDLLAGLLETATRFEELVSTHAQDRDQFEMMLGACEAQRDEQTDERWRKQSFMGNSYVWGVRAKTYFTLLMLHPSARNGFFDMARVHGLLGLVRTRPNVRWPFAQSVVYSAEDERHPMRAPLLESEATRATGVPLLEPFCSQPLPAVQRRVGQMGMLEDELLPGAMGETGESTIFTGEALREVAPIYQTEPDENAMFGTGVRTPSALLIYDHLVHHALFPETERRLRVYSELISPVTRDERDLLPVPEKVEHLGRGGRRLRTAEVPRYQEMMDVICERLGWKLEDFEHYRVRMRYPPMPTAVMVEHDLPAVPAGFSLD